MIVNHLKEMEKLIRSLSPRHRTYQVFSDFVEMAACSISNAVDPSHYEEREKRYMDIVKKYKKEEVDAFPKLLGHLTMALEEEPSDVLGNLYHSLEIQNERAGQFFTPYHVSKMMAKMILADNSPKTIIEEKGFIRASEPACGAGGMVIALAEALKEDGINYQDRLHVTAVDLDPTCVHMAYVQCSLLHIPAVIVHGNTLTLEEFSHWRTPAHIMGFWDSKLKRGEPRTENGTDAQEMVAERTTDESVTQPTPQITEAKREEKVERGQQLSLF